MVETGPNGTIELETPADLQKKISQLERQRQKDREKIADLEHKNGVQAKALIELADRVGRLDKKPSPPTPREIKANNDKVRPNYNSGADAYRKGIEKFKAEQAANQNAGDPYAELGRRMQQAGINDQNGPLNEEEFYTRQGAPSAAERNWEMFGDKMRQAGMTQDTAPAHEEEFYTGVGNTEPPGPPNPGESNPYTTEVQSLISAQEALREQAQRLDGVMTDFARHRVDRERMLSGKTARNEIEASSQNLNAAFAEWSQALSALVMEENREVFERTRAIRADLDEAHQHLAQLEALPENERPADFQDQVTQTGSIIRTLENLNSQNEQNEAMIQATINARINEKLMEVRARVDFEMTAERERRHPKLAKVGNWLRTHKKTRIAAGVALAGIGFIGVATGNAPLAVGAMAGRAALRGIGTNEAVRGVGDLLADRGARKSNVTNIEEYTESAKKQSGRKHRWNRGAAVAGAGLAAAPLIGNLAHVTEAAPPQAPPAPKPPDWLSSREFAEMVHHPNTFQKFMSWTESMKAQGWTDAKIAEALSKLPPAPEGFGS